MTSTSLCRRKRRLQAYSAWRETHGRPYHSQSVQRRHEPNAFCSTRRQGRLTRNVVALVDRVPGKAKKFETFTPEQLKVVLQGITEDCNRHAWHLALAGLRRGEIAGQRWDDVNFETRTLRIGATRVDVGGRALDQDEPKPPPPDACFQYPTPC